MTSALLLLLFAACVAGIRSAAIWVRRPMSRLALGSTVGLPLLFLLPGFFTATTPLPADHALSLWPWHVLTEAPKYNSNLNDIATQFVPWAKAVRMAYKEGSLPLRDRWNGCGTPLAANGQSAAFSPFTVLGLILPLARAATLTSALKLALALAGMWLWLRELRVSDSGALFGAVSFTFSMMIPWLLFPHTAVICFWPWALFAVELLRDREASARAFVVLAAIFAVWPLCGHIESVALGCAFLALWIASRAVVARDLPGFLRLTRWILAAASLALALSAFALIPQALAIRASNRFALSPHPFWSETFSLLPRASFWRWGLLTPLFPRILGDEIAAPMIEGAAGSFPEMALGAIGLVAWTLALCVFRRGGRRNRSEWALLAPMAFGLGAAINLWPFAEIAGAIPLLRLMFPLRFFSWLALGGAALAAFEVDRLVRDLAAGRRAWIFPSVTALALAGLASVVFPHFAKLHAASGGWPAERRAWIFSVAVLCGVAAACAGSGLFRFRPALLPALLIVLSAAALFWDGKRIHRFHSTAGLYPETPLVRFLETLPQPFRVVGQGSVMFPNSNVFAGVEDVRTHDPVERRDYVEFLDANCGYEPGAYFKRIRDVNAPALDLLNVRYLVSGPGGAAPAAKWKPVYSGADGTVFENSDALPRFFPADPARRVEISRYRERTNWISFHAGVPGERPANAAGSIVQDGGWSARDESGRKLSTARYRELFLAISIPPGEHELILEYSPPGFRTGCWISLGGLFVVILLARSRARRI